MRRRELERWFDRFRSKGDLRALEKVFDKTARDLLSVAQHLVGDVHDAEDLVQATFVTAIERASTFDRNRDLRPWLCGILAHKAAAQWRSDARRPKGVEVPGDGTERPVVLRPLGDPAEPLVATELEGKVAGAIERMPDAYQAVLRPLLCEGKRAEQIARELGEAPGTVRMRIHRGLVRLRAMLPAGLTAGLAWTTLAPRGLTAVKGAILEHAGASAAVSVAGLGSASVMTGGLVMAKNTGAWVAGAAILLIGVGVTVQQVGLGETGGVEVLSQGEDPEVELTQRSARLDGVEGHGAERDDVAVEGAHASERESARLSSAILEGRVHGVHPDDAAAVEVEVTWEHPMTVVDVEHEMLQSRLLDTLGTIYADYPGSDVDVRSATLRPQVLEVQSTYALNAPGRIRSLAEIPNGDRVELDESVEAQLDPIDLPPMPGAVLAANLDRDGRFRVDLSPWFEALGEDAPLPSFSVRAAHPLYFEGDSTVAVAPEGLERFRDGEEVLLRTELHLDPACVLSGRIESEQEVWVLPNYTPQLDAVEGTQDFASLLAPTASSEPVVLTFVVNSFAPDQAGVVSGISLGASTGFAWHWNQDSCALFAMEGGAPMSEPVTTGTLEGDGSFRLTVREAGEYLLCVMKGDKRPFTLPVTLESRVERVLDEALVVEQGVEAGGVVDDFGLKPEGGVGVTATRLPESGDLPVHWSHYELVWSGNAFERTQVHGTSDEEGLFTLAGLGPGRHRLSLGDAADVNTKGSTAKAGANLDVRLPNDHVRLELQASMLEIELYVDGVRTVLDELEEGEGGAENEAASLREARVFLIVLGKGDAEDEIVGEGSFNGDGRLRALVEPGRNYAIDVLAQGYANTRVVKQAPHAGQREVISSELESLER